MHATAESASTTATTNGQAFHPAAASVFGRREAEVGVGRAVAPVPVAEDEGATGAALGFIDAVEHAFTHISRQPGTGSPRYAHELNLPGLRTWLLTPYPHLVFYLERPDHIDVWRVLHGRRDIPAWLLEAEVG